MRLDVIRTKKMKHKKTNYPKSQGQRRNKNSWNNNNRKISTRSLGKANLTGKRKKILAVVSVKQGLTTDRQLQSPQMAETKAANWISELNERKFRF